MCRIHLLAALSAGLFFTSAQGRVLYDLGLLTGDVAESTSAVDINNSGEIAGNSDRGPIKHAFRYTGLPGAGGSFVEFPGAHPFVDVAVAHGINEAGVLTGFTVVEHEGGVRGFITSASGELAQSLSPLGTFGATGNERRRWGSYSNAINDSGTTAGQGGLSDNKHATGPGGDATRGWLGNLGGSSSVAWGLNNRGQTVGESKTGGDLSSRAFLFTPAADLVGGTMFDLGTLGGTNSSARAINERGQIVGGSKLPGDVETHAFLYVGLPGSGGRMVDLGALDGGSSIARDINEHGHIVGNSADGSGSPFLYVGTPGFDGQMTDLNAWLRAIDPSNPYTLVEAAAINDRGQIAGTATRPAADGSSIKTAVLLDVIALTGIPGDTDRDYDVDYTDLVTLALHYRQSGHGWDAGDFNSDDEVDFSDLLLLAQHYTSVEWEITGTNAFARDWQLARALVPEPAVVTASAAMLLGLRRQRR